SRRTPLEPGGARRLQHRARRVPGAQADLWGRRGGQREVVTPHIVRCFDGYVPEESLARVFAALGGFEGKALQRTSSFRPPVAAKPPGVGGKKVLGGHRPRVPSG